MDSFISAILKQRQVAMTKPKHKKDDDEFDRKLKEIQTNLAILLHVLNMNPPEKESEAKLVKKVLRKLIYESQESLNIIIPARKRNYVSKDILDSRAWNETYRSND